MAAPHFEQWALRPFAPSGTFSLFPQEGQVTEAGTGILSVG
jgi:hypothetical protein